MDGIGIGSLLGIAASMMGFGLWPYLTLTEKSAAKARLEVVERELTQEESGRVGQVRILDAARRAAARPGLLDASRTVLLGECAFYEELLAQTDVRIAALRPELLTLRHTVNMETAESKLRAAADRALRVGGRRRTGIAEKAYVYLASSWRNPDSEAAVAQLRAAGFETYDFKNPHHPARDGGGFSWSAVDPVWKEWSPSAYRDAMRHPIAQEGLRLDREALARASATVLLTPCGRSAHLEAGWAKGSGQIVIAVARPGFEVELMWGLFDAIVTSMDEAIEILKTAFPVLTVPEPAEAPLAAGGPPASPTLPKPQIPAVVVQAAPVSKRTKGPGRAKKSSPRKGRRRS